MKKVAFLRTYAGLNRAVYVLFVARIINSLGKFVYPFLTLYLTQKLSLSTDAAGRILMLFALGFLPGILLGGKLADQRNRKSVLLFFQAASALAFVPCAFLIASPLIPWLLVASSFFGGAAPPIMGAMITDLSSPEQRKAAFSLSYLGHNLGVALGPLIAGFLYNHHLPWLFLGDAATTLASLLLILRFVPETHPAAAPPNAGSVAVEERAETGSLLQALLARPMLLAFILILPLHVLVCSQYSFSLPLQLARLFGAAGPPRFGMLMSVNALTVIFATPLMVHATRKMRPLLATALCAVLYALGFGMIFWIRSLTLLVVSTLIWTCGEILGAVHVSVHIANCAPVSHRGRFNAILPITNSLGYGGGPALMGLFLRSHDIRQAWPLLAGCAGVVALALVLLDRLERRGHREAPACLTPCCLKDQG